MTTGYNMEWSMDDALQLIEQYRIHPELWNRSYPKYKDKLCRFRAWSDIAEKFGCTKAEVERKMNVLLTQYRREKQKLLMKLYEGITPGPSKWYAFKRFEFLEGSGSDGSMSAGVGRRKSRDLKNLYTIGLGLPMMISNSHNIPGWNGTGSFPSSAADRKGLCVSLPIGFPNVQNADLVNSRLPYNNQKNETSETIEIDEKDDDQTTQPATSPQPMPVTSHMPTEPATDDLEIKQEVSDFLHHHPPTARTESNRSYTSSTEDNRIENDDYAQDLRVSATARGIDFSRFGLARELLQQNEAYDTKFSPSFPRKQQNNHVHSNTQPTGGVTAGNNEHDDCDYVGSNVSIKLRSMERTQRIIAEKLISEVLFYGQIAELEKTAKILPK